MSGTVQSAGSGAGLTEADAQRRLRERGPQPKDSSSRSYQSIAIANTFTIFNAILAAFGGPCGVRGRGQAGGQALTCPGQP